MLKRDWNEPDYQLSWKLWGKPRIEDTWYGKFGWDEEPATRDSETGRWPYYWPV